MERRRLNFRSAHPFFFCFFLNLCVFNFTYMYVCVLAARSLNLDSNPLGARENRNEKKKPTRRQKNVFEARFCLFLSYLFIFSLDAWVAHAY